MDFYSKATKHPDRMTVKVAAVTLMMVNKTTTTLEVKAFYVIKDTRPTKKIFPR